MGVRLVKGVNDLKTWALKNNPSIIEEWDVEKNREELGLEIDEVSYCSHKKAYFTCKFCNTTSLCNISDRSLKHSRCGACANSNHTSYPEQLVYLILSYVEPETEYQFTLGKFKYDVGIEKLKLCVEYNSYWTHLHYGNGTEDRKAEVCKDNGYTLITICDYLEEDIIDYDSESMTYSYKENSDKLKNLYSICKHLLEKYGYEVNLTKEELIKISTEAKENALNKRRVVTSLLDKVPDITKEWAYDLNGGIRPEDVTYGSTQKYWFRCSKGHEYLAAPKYKSSKNPTGCKICHDTRVRDSKLIVKDYPLLAIEYDLDNKVDVRDITYGCTKEKSSWTCPNCGYKFITTTGSRVYCKSGCKRCNYNWFKLMNQIPQKLRGNFTLNIAKIKELYEARKSAGLVE